MKINKKRILLVTFIIIFVVTLILLIRLLMKKPETTTTGSDDKNEIYEDLTKELKEKGYTDKEIEETKEDLDTQYEETKKKLIEEGYSKEEAEESATVEMLEIAEGLKKNEENEFANGVEVLGYMANNVDVFMDYIKNGEYEKAYALLSEDCKHEEFDNIYTFTNYCQKKFVTERGLREISLGDEVKIDANTYYVRAELKSKYDNSTLYEYITVRFKSGAEDVTDFEIGFNKFVRTEKPQKSIDLNGATIEINRINRYIDRADVFFMVTNKSDDRIIVGDEANRKTERNGVTWAEDTYLTANLNGQDYSYYLKLADLKERPYYYYFYKQGNNTKSFTFEIPIKANIKKFTTNVSINGEYKKAEIDL